ncbi:MAG: CHC2 zinc finger domain-containing protein [Burkholderiales bacterium]
MARVPDELVKRLKAEVALVRLVETAGVTLKRHGAALLALCPFHDDHEPSLVITAEKNLWHCLSACQMGGSVIDCGLHGVRVNNAQCSTGTARAPGI